MKRGVCGFLFVLLLTGCGSTQEQERVIVTGSVQWQKKKLAGALVTFVPIGDTPGGGGSGRTDADGSFQLTDVRGAPGIPAGEYKVWISLRLLPDGTREKEAKGAEDSQAREQLPEVYSSAERTTLSEKVSDDRKVIHFDLP
jgi:hypothetical protein